MSIAIFGSTGSVGKNALKVIQSNPDKFNVYALATHSNIDLLEEQVRKFHPTVVVVYDKEKGAELKSRLSNTKILFGIDGLMEIASDPMVDFALFAMTGTEGLRPAICAIKEKKKIGIANKELLVCSGKLITDLAKQNDVDLLPVDSEHSAIFQCLRNENSKHVKRLILAASGGPFRKYSYKQLNEITVDDALAHPNWKMGSKITVDSSTLMNKGLEVIEAHFLFDIPIENIDVVIHPQSIVHSMVEFCDGSILAQMSEPDMVLPIQYAFSYPNRIFSPSTLDMTKPFHLDFEPVDYEKFNCLALAIKALKLGKSYPCFLNAANEVLVKRFLNREIHWLDIGNTLKKLIASHTPVNMIGLEAILAVEKQAKEAAGQI